MPITDWVIPGKPNEMPITDWVIPGKSNRSLDSVFSNLFQIFTICLFL